MHVLQYYIDYVFRTAYLDLDWRGHDTLFPLSNIIAGKCMYFVEYMAWAMGVYQKQSRKKTVPIQKRSPEGAGGGGGGRWVCRTPTWRMSMNGSPAADYN